MNRMAKEELRRYREARKGLSPAEIAELDRREAEEEAFQKRVRSWHGRLFPEEYDFYYDSIADARDRARGINPMSDEFIARTDARRKALGFAAYGFDGPSTWDWVEHMLREGRENELQALCLKFGLR